jgi:hypothetical protein
MASRLFITVLLVSLFLVGCTTGSGSNSGKEDKADDKIKTMEGNVLTPYKQYKAPDEYYNGATLTLERKADTPAWLTAQLETMKNRYLINTISLYDLENFDEAGSHTNTEHLFKELARLEMKAVVRIEAYDPVTFAFDAAEDVPDVMGRYTNLLEYISSDEARRASVAYFAVNMPVDDGKVQEHVGGVNSERSKTQQTAYATAILSALRTKAAGFGFPDAPFYLSVFYGWDNTYEVPSYENAGADGYFINNYSYLEGERVPEANENPDTIINSDRLAISMDKFKEQYGADKPCVIEFGIHTLQYNDGVKPSQTAGLVSDLDAKAIALKATADFYEANYPFVNGLMYFGYNLFKEEGNPPAVMDWALDYPARGEMIASERTLIGGAAVAEDVSSESGTAVLLADTGAGLDFRDCPAVRQVRLTYKADAPATLGFYSEGKLKQKKTLPAAADYTVQSVSLTVIEGYDLQITLEEGAECLISTVGLYEMLEAENASLSGMAAVKFDKEASMGAEVTGAIGSDNKLTFSETQGGDTLNILYKAFSPVTVALETAGEKFVVNLPKTEGWSLESAKIDMPADSDFTIYAEQGAVEFDAFFQTGVPSAPLDDADKTDAPADETAVPQGGDSGISRVVFYGGLILAALLLGLTVVTLIRYRKRINEAKQRDER